MMGIKSVVSAQLSVIRGCSYYQRMKSSLFTSQAIGSIFRIGLLSVVGMLSIPALTTAQASSLQLVVNSNQDNIQADEFLTLREAIEIANGNLDINQLSKQEQQLISGNFSVNKNEGLTRITFNLPPTATTIAVNSALPAIASPNLVIDGTTQPGYNTSTVTPGEMAIVIPVVGITPVADAKISRGLTIVADGVTIRGLKIYGFTADHDATSQTPPADIFISHPLPPPNTSQQKIPNPDAPFYDWNIPPKDIVIEDNWLGVGELSAVSCLSSEDCQLTASSKQQSAFGVYVFNSEGVKIYRNAIANHQGSGIITSVRANNLVIQYNLIANNGFAGMPDAIRLEGKIYNTVISSNVIRNNAGSAIFAFKPSGGAEINANVISDNGRRFERAAIYLTGSEHKVINNQIMNQPGPGVVVAAFPNSDRNIIENNQFTNLQGLSIDLIAQFGTEVNDYQEGDGPNPPIQDYQQQRQTGNLGINPPEFSSREFFSALPDNTVTLVGKALPGAQVQIYRVRETGEKQGPLNQAMGSVEVDENGQFALSLEGLQPGERVSAIATHPEYGTSEPAVNALIRSLVSDVSTP